MLLEENMVSMSLKMDYMALMIPKQLIKNEISSFSKFLKDHQLLNTSKARFLLTQFSVSYIQQTLNMLTAQAD